MAGFEEDESWVLGVREIAKQITDLGSPVTFMLAPSAPQLCRDHLLISCRDLVHELNPSLPI